MSAAWELVHTPHQHHSLHSALSLSLHFGSPCRRHLVLQHVSPTRITILHILAEDTTGNPSIAGDLWDHSIALTHGDTSMSSKIILKKPICLTGSPVSLPPSRGLAPYPQTCCFLTWSLTDCSSWACSAVQRQVMPAYLLGMKTSVVGLALCIWRTGCSQTDRIRHVDLKCSILYYSYNINIRTFISLYPQF